MAFRIMVQYSHCQFSTAFNSWCQWKH